MVMVRLDFLIIDNDDVKIEQIRPTLTTIGKNLDITVAVYGLNLKIYHFVTQLVVPDTP